MYESFLEGGLPDEVRDVFEHLKAVSENHQQAFENGVSCCKLSDPCIESAVTTLLFRVSVKEFIYPLKMASGI